MKRNSIFILALAAIFVAAAGMKPVPQDNPPVKKKDAHIKVVTIKDGEKHVLDTIIESKDLKVMHQSMGKNFTWTTAHASSLQDSLKEKSGVMMGAGKGSNFIIRKRGQGMGPIEIREMETLGDSGKMVTVHVEKSGPGEEDIFIMRPGMGPQRRMVHAQMVPGMRMPNVRAPRVRHSQSRNVIDLSDPGIISFEKKKLSGGREKITIIRNEMKQEENEVFDVREGEKVDKELIKDLPHIEREIKIRKEELNPSEIEKK